MRLKELNEGIASACNVRASVVTAVQAETFKQLRSALDKGEKIIIPDFGMFSIRDVAAEGDEPARKVVRFRERKAGEGKKKEGGGGKRKKAEAKSEGGGDE